MGYDHTLQLVAKVELGTPVSAVAEAFAPYFTYAGYDGIDAFTMGNTVLGEDRFTYDPETGEVDVATCGEVCYSFIDMVTAIAENLGNIVCEPGEIWLYNHDTGDIDEAKTIIEFGHSKEEILNYMTNRDINAALEVIGRHVSAEALEQMRTIATESIRRFSPKPQ